MPLSLSDFIREMSLDSGERSNNGIEMIDAAINSQKEPDFEGFPPKVHLEPAKARSRIKIFTVMTALFVSTLLHLCQIQHLLPDPLYTSLPCSYQL